MWGLHYTYKKPPAKTIPGNLALRIHMHIQHIDFGTRGLQM